jgi:hypothetical protein
MPVGTPNSGYFWIGDHTTVTPKNIGDVRLNECIALKSPIDNHLAVV